VTEFDVDVECPACGARFQVARIRRGSIERCPVCAFEVRVPGGSAYEEHAPPAEQADSAIAPAAVEAAAAIEGPAVRPCGRCAVCAAEEGRVNPLVAAPIICAMTGAIAAEVRVQVVKGKGLLAEGVPDPVARRLVAALRAAQVPVFAVDEAWVPRVERELPLIRVHDVTDAGLHAQTDPRGTVRAVPWRTVAGAFCTKEFMVRGGPPELRADHKVGLGALALGMPMVTGRTAYHAARRPAQPEARCTLLLRGSSGRLYSMQFSQSRVRYSYLGGRRGSGVRQNFALVLADIIRHCPHGFFPRSTRDVAAGRLHRIARLKARGDYERYLRWVLCCLGHMWHASRDGGDAPT